MAAEPGLHGSTPDRVGRGLAPSDVLLNQPQGTREKNSTALKANVLPRNGNSYTAGVFCARPQTGGAQIPQSSAQTQEIDEGRGKRLLHQH